MTSEPQIKSLSKKYRTWLFVSLFLVFIITLPAMIFYTTGYRLNFSEEESRVVTTGGISITADSEFDVYIDDKREDGRRFFGQNYYIQDIEAGIHRIVVQGEGVQTWVKDLPVDSHRVVGAASFNMPELPQLRPITELVTEDGLAVFLSTSTVESLFQEATSTEPYVASSTLLEEDLNENEEFVFIDSLFGTSTDVARMAFGKELIAVERFGFATSSPQQPTTTVSVVEEGNVRLIERENELIATWTSNIDDIPFYYCIERGTASSTRQRYGDHVAEAVFGEARATSTIFFEEERICRTEIKLNDLRQTILAYHFYPDSSDLVLLLLEDGLYVTEIDDRAWQNTQLLYPGSDFSVVVENDQIYLKEGDLYFELITEIELE
jgi:hypothetical protein